MAEFGKRTKREARALAQGADGAEVSRSLPKPFVASVERFRESWYRLMQAVFDFLPLQVSSMDVDGAEADADGGQPPLPPVRIMHEARSYLVLALLSTSPLIKLAMIAPS